MSSNILMWITLFAIYKSFESLSNDKKFATWLIISILSLAMYVVVFGFMVAEVFGL